MAENSLGYFYDTLGLSSLRIFYEFTGVSGVAIPSTEPGSPLNSGAPTNLTIVNQSGMFTETSSVLIKGIDSDFDTFGTHIFNFERTILCEITKKGKISNSCSSWF